MNIRISLLLVSLLTFNAYADNDPNRPVNKISQDLGISAAQFRECFMPIRPEKNKRPSKHRQQQNKALLLPCLQKYNPQITNERLDQVMDKYRPEGAMP